MSDHCECGIPWAQGRGYCDRCQMPEPAPPPPTNAETIAALKVWIRAHVDDLREPCTDARCDEFTCMVVRYIRALDEFTHTPVPADIRVTIERMIKHVVGDNETSPVFHEVHAVAAWLKEQR